MGWVVLDISVIGFGFQIIMGGEMSEVLGISVSVFVVVVMVVLINDVRMCVGKQSFGWLNFLLYLVKVRVVFRDVMVGESYGCLFFDGSMQDGWFVVQGYDCVMGFGVVRQFDEFMEVLLQISLSFKINKYEY